MKKINNLLLLLPVLFICLSCSSKRTDISLFLYNSEDIFINQLSDKLKDNLSDYSLKVYDASKSQLKQNEQLQEALNDGTKIIIMNTVDRLASKAIIEKCSKYNVPVMFFNREPLLEDMIDYNDCYYVGPNPDSQGELQATFASTLFEDPTSLNPKYDLNSDNKIQVLILKGEQGHQDAEKRTKSSINKLQDLGYQVEILNIEVCNWERQAAYTSMQNLYPIFGEQIELILSNNDEMAIGAANYLLDNNIFSVDNIVPIIGVDATLSGKQAIADKKIASTVVNDDEQQSKALSELCSIYLNKDKTIDDLTYNLTNSKFIFVDSTIYTNF